MAIFLLVSCAEQTYEMYNEHENEVTKNFEELYIVSEGYDEQYVNIAQNNMSENIIDEPISVLLPSLTLNRNIAAGTFHSMVIIDGNLWAWGYNWYGQLGDGTMENRATPVQIGIDTDWVSVCVSWSHSVALKADGSLWAWGNNEFGNLGDGTTENRASPVQISDANWSYVATGDNHTMAIKADGTLWGWGWNAHNQVVDNVETEYGELSIVLKPIQIGINTDWVRVMPGWRHTTALRADGSLWFWGYDTNVFSRRNRVPTRIGTYEDLIRMLTPSSGRANFEIKDDGSLWAWGYNFGGQLGDGTTINRSIPVQIGTSTDWVDIAMGDGRAVGVKADGSVWSWGWVGLLNHDVEFIEVFSLIGDGGDEDRHSPVQIIPPRHER